MLEKDSRVHQIREDYIQYLYNEACNGPSYNSFKSNVFNVIVKIGLLLNAKRDCLFDNVDWSDPNNRDLLLKRILTFLRKHVK